MLDKLDWADFVLLICTETYYRRFRGHEQSDMGRGVDWEGQLITLEIYNAKSRTTKFVPIIFGSQDKEFIPEPLSDQFYLFGFGRSLPGTLQPTHRSGRRAASRTWVRQRGTEERDRASDFWWARPKIVPLPVSLMKFPIGCRATPTSGTDLTPHGNKDSAI